MSASTHAVPNRSGMTVADYETIAAVLHDSPALEGLPGQQRALALDMAEALCAGSARFNPVTFVQMVDASITVDEVVDWGHALRLRVERQEYKSNR